MVSSIDVCFSFMISKMVSIQLRFLYFLYSLVLNKRHAVIVDTANFKGPKLGHLFDSTTEILLIGFASTTGQINPIFIKVCLENHRVMVFEKFKFAMFSSSSPCLLLSTKE